jgi:hypothetical protein
MGAVDPGFDEVGDDQFEACNQQEYGQRPEPSITNAQRERDPQGRSNQRSHVWHNPQNAGDHGS